MARTSNDNANNFIESNPIKPVNEAVQEYRIIEDGALAQHLQKREIEYHLALNVQQRKTVMEDIKAAKILQDEEDRKAQIFTINQQEEIKQQDEKLAEVIQSELVENQIKEDEEKRKIEAHDSELALRMRERDKYYERRREERDYELAQKMANVEISEEKRKQLSDEDLAWKLQEEERKKLKKKKQSREHMKAVIEMQDEELARYIHEKEMEEIEMMKRHEHSVKKSKRNQKGSYPEEPHSTRSHSPDQMGSSRNNEKPPHRPPPPRSGHEYSHHGSREMLQYHDEDYHPGTPPRSPHDKKLRKKKDHAPQRLPPRRNVDDHSNDELKTSRSNERAPHRDEDYHHERSRKERHHGLPRPSSSHSSGPPSPTRLQRRNSQDLLESSGTRSNFSSREYHDEEATDNPWTRFPHSSPTHHKNSPTDDLSYGDGLKRLEKQESWNQPSNPLQERKKKSSKGDCKQQ